MVWVVCGCGGGGGWGGGTSRAIYGTFDASGRPPEQEPGGLPDASRFQRQVEMCNIYSPHLLICSI